MGRPNEGIGDALIRHEVIVCSHNRTVWRHESKSDCWTLEKWDPSREKILLQKEAFVRMNGLQRRRKKSSCSHTIRGFSSSCTPSYCVLVVFRASIFFHFLRNGWNDFSMERGGKSGHPIKIQMDDCTSSLRSHHVCPLLLLRGCALLKVFPVGENSGFSLWFPSRCTGDSADQSTQQIRRLRSLRILCRVFTKSDLANPQTNVSFCSSHETMKKLCNEHRIEN